MNLRTIAKKCRHIADSIDDLLEEAETPAKAAKIRKTLKTHWTQRPENKAKLAAATRKGHKTRGAK